MNEQPEDLIILQRAPEKIVIRRDEQLALIEPPHLRIEMRTVPSWNDFLGLAHHKSAAAGMMKSWRTKGHDKAIFFARRGGLEVMELEHYDTNSSGRLKKTVVEHVAAKDAFHRCEIVLRYWRPTWNIFDATNPMVKPILDGFTDAGVLFKDNQEHLFKYGVEFMGVDDRLKLSDEAKERKRFFGTVKKKYSPMQGRYWFDLYHR